MIGRPLCNSFELEIENEINVKMYSWLLSDSKPLDKYTIYA